MTTDPETTRLLQVKGPALARYALHIGAHHLPCQVEAERLLIRPNAALSKLLGDMGAELVEVDEIFCPEDEPVRSNAHGQVRHHSSHTHIEDEEENAADEV